MKSKDLEIQKFCISELNTFISDNINNITTEQWFLEYLLSMLFVENEDEIKVNTLFKSVRMLLDTSKFNC